MRERRMRVSAVAFLATVATTLAAFVLPGAAISAPPGCANRTNTTYQQLLDVRDARRCSRASGKRSRTIADANDDEFYPGTRAAGTEGYAESVEYVAGLIEGRRVQRDARSVRSSRSSSRSLIHQLTPVDADYPRPARSPAAASVSVTGQRHAGRHQPRTATRERRAGARRRDFAGDSRPGQHRPDPAWDVHLRGQGGRTPRLPAPRPSSSSTRATTRRARRLIVGTLLPGGESVTIPVVGASFADGVALAAGGLHGSVRVRRARDAHRRERHRGAAGQQREQRRHGRRAPRLRPGRPRHQRQRLRIRSDPRDRADDGEGQAREHDPLRMVGRGGGGPRRLDGLRRRAVAGRAAIGSPCT